MKYLNNILFFSGLCLSFSTGIIGQNNFFTIDTQHYTIDQQHEFTSNLVKEHELTSNLVKEHELTSSLVKEQEFKSSLPKQRNLLKQQEWTNNLLEEHELTSNLVKEQEFKSSLPKQQFDKVITIFKEMIDYDQYTVPKQIEFNPEDFVTAGKKEGEKLDIKSNISLQQKTKNYKFFTTLLENNIGPKELMVTMLDCLIDLLPLLGIKENIQNKVDFVYAYSKCESMHIRAVLIYNRYFIDKANITKSVGTNREHSKLYKTWSEKQKLVPGKEDTQGPIVKDICDLIDTQSNLLFSLTQLHYNEEINTIKIKAHKNFEKQESEIPSLKECQTIGEIMNHPASLLACMDRPFGLFFQKENVSIIMAEELGESLNGQYKEFNIVLNRTMDHIAGQLQEKYETFQNKNIQQVRQECVSYALNDKNRAGLSLEEKVIVYSFGLLQKSYDIFCTLPNMAFDNNSSNSALMPYGIMSKNEAKIAFGSFDLAPGKAEKAKPKDKSPAINQLFHYDADSMTKAHYLAKLYSAEILDMAYKIRIKRDAQSQKSEKAHRN